MTMRGSGVAGRVLVVALGVLLALGGLALIAQGADVGPGGFWLVVVGLAFVIAATIERWRYRSGSADLAGLPIGPGGGEPLEAPLEPRFQRTEEAFVDPTSGQRMRVWLDPASGERRYRAEG